MTMTAIVRTATGSISGKKHDGQNSYGEIHIFQPMVVTIS